MNLALMLRVCEGIVLATSVTKYVIWIFINLICGKKNAIIASDYISVIKESNGLSFGGLWI